MSALQADLSCAACFALKGLVGVECSNNDNRIPYIIFNI
jgi:hypothetical protein